MDIFPTPQLKIAKGWAIQFNLFAINRSTGSRVA